MLGALSLVLCALPVSTQAPAAARDPYADYVSASEDFRAVKQDRDWALRAFPSWTYMPWTHRWTIGYDDAAGEWSLAHGYNGAFLDRGAVGAGGSPTGKLDWIDRFGLRFYVDHVADKGYLHLWDGDVDKAQRDALHGAGMRPHPLGAPLRTKLEAFVQKHLAPVTASPNRAAYALDDEPSWGHFVHPTMWRITDDEEAYPRWLREVYGAEAAPERARWNTYEDLRRDLARWRVADFDASPLMDQWSFNDSLWSNFIGGLVEHANALDPATPCGIVGGQMPSPFGGYDYAKLMRKVQFIESYDLGSSQAIIRSFNPRDALPSVTTHFFQGAADSAWQTWYYLAHGNRGHIGWVDGWFDGETPRAWHATTAPARVEAATRIGPLVAGAEWMHDGVALYYSHASIQLGWILDAEAHGKTWVNRNSDERLASAALVRRAWENMLRDSGVQYDFVSYVDVIQRGVPDEYKVLILPACLCLSDVEARHIREFCARGGTVIADYLPGVWDQHGRGRKAGGALDDLFGVRHAPTLSAKDVFGERLWVETDQDRNYSYRTYDELLTRGSSCVVDATGFHKAVRALPTQVSREHGEGRAVLMNLSPQWYNAWRVAGAAPSGRRSAFMRYIAEAGVTPWARVTSGGEPLHGHEVTYWRRLDGRIVLFVVQNPELCGTSTGGGGSVGLVTGKVEVTVRFGRNVREVRDERRDVALEGQGEGGREFSLEYERGEALVLSFDAP